MYMYTNHVYITFIAACTYIHTSILNLSILCHTTDYTVCLVCVMQSTSLCTDPPWTYEWHQSDNNTIIHISKGTVQINTDVLVHRTKHLDWVVQPCHGNGIVCYNNLQFLDEILYQRLFCASVTYTLQNCPITFCNVHVKSYVCYDFVSMQCDLQTAIPLTIDRCVVRGRTILSSDFYILSILYTLYAFCCVWK